MKIVILIVIGLCGGLIGGMGMGGGTLLIPLLTICAGIEQHLAQSINLIAFIPMSIAALIIHIKNGLVEYKYLLWLSLPAVAASVFSSWLTRVINGKALSKYFGIFLVVLGVYQLLTIIIGNFRNRAEKKRIEEENKHEKTGKYGETTKI